MALREFMDSYGQRWRAWDVTPESIHPVTRSEDYLADCYRGGWLVFETPDGVQKRRLCPLPYGWEQRADPDLERLLDLAEIISPRPSAAGRDRTITVDLPPNVPPRAAREIPRTPAGDLDLRYLGVVRGFKAPDGRAWTARIVAEPGGDGAVLRFASGDRVKELREWPAGWIDCSAHDLARLLHSASSSELPESGVRTDPGDGSPRDERTGAR